MNQVQFERNQKLLSAARKEVFQRGGIFLTELLPYRINPADPSYPLAYRRLDRYELRVFAARLGATPQDARRHAQFLASCG
jgi:hypothetical protein